MNYRGHREILKEVIEIEINVKLVKQRAGIRATCHGHGNDASDKKNKEKAVISLKMETMSHRNYFYLAR